MTSEWSGKWANAEAAGTDVLVFPGEGDVGEVCYESVAYKSLTTLSRRAELTRGFDYDELMYTGDIEGDDGHIHSKSAMNSTCMNTPCARKVMRC